MVKKNYLFSVFFSFLFLIPLGLLIPGPNSVTALNEPTSIELNSSSIHDYYIILNGSQETSSPVQFRGLAYQYQTLVVIHQLFTENDTKYDYYLIYMTIVNIDEESAFIFPELKITSSIFAEPTEGDIEIIDYAPTQGIYPQYTGDFILTANETNINKTIYVSDNIIQTKTNEYTNGVSLTWEHTYAWNKLLTQRGLSNQKISTFSVIKVQDMGGNQSNGNIQLQWKIDFRPLAFTYDLNPTYSIDYSTPVLALENAQ
ncbi:MAG: hypothetical protein ACTSUV_00325 [Candidatus Ranarchaeia archaeon]